MQSKAGTDKHSSGRSQVNVEISKTDASISNYHDSRVEALKLQGKLLFST